MRLLTFQAMQVLEGLCSKGVYYMEERTGHRMKSVDRKYCVDGNMPVYAFASIDGLPVSLEAVFGGMQTINSVGGLTDRLMLELEVPESEILSMKRCLLFEDRIGEEYTRDFGKRIHDEFYTDNKITYEVLLPYLKYEWLVCSRIPTRGFIEINRRRFSSVQWDTVVLRMDRYPLWCSSITSFASYKMFDPVIFEPIEDVENYLSSKCSPELLVVQALCGVLTEDVGITFCKDYLGTDNLEEAIKSLQYTDKTYMKDYGYQ